MSPPITIADRTCTNCGTVCSAAFVRCYGINGTVVRCPSCPGFSNLDDLHEFL